MSILQFTPSYSWFEWDVLPSKPCSRTDAPGGYATFTLWSLHVLAHCAAWPQGVPVPQQEKAGIPESAAEPQEEA